MDSRALHLCCQVNTVFSGGVAFALLQLSALCRAYFTFGRERMRTCREAEDVSSHADSGRRCALADAHRGSTVTGPVIIIWPHIPALSVQQTGSPSPLICCREFSIRGPLSLSPAAIFPACLFLTPSPTSHPTPDPPALPVPSLKPWS